MKKEQRAKGGFDTLRKMCVEVLERFVVHAGDAIRTAVPAASAFPSPGRWLQTVQSRLVFLTDKIPLGIFVGAGDVA